VILQVDIVFTKEDQSMGGRTTEVITNLRNEEIFKEEVGGEF
jgi:hypothetical protein